MSSAKNVNNANKSLDVEIIHPTLLDAALPSTIEDLKNPKEDYVVNLLTTFLTRFGINMSLIDQVRFQISYICVICHYII